MRLAAKAKAGFYPTPPRVVDLILRYLDGGPLSHILDPCAGEGEALSMVCAALGARGFGVELSRERAKRAASKGLRVHQGAISGALKRAAVAWGIGRELYNYPRIVVEGEHRYIPYKVLERLKGLPKAVAEGKPLPEVIRLNAEGETVRRGG